MPNLNPNYWYLVNLTDIEKPHLLVGGSISKKICEWILNTRLPSRKNLKPILGEKALQQGIPFDVEDRVPGLPEKVRVILPNHILGNARAAKNYRNKKIKRKRKSRRDRIKRVAKIKAYILTHKEQVNKLTIKQICKLYPEINVFAFTIPGVEYWYFKKDCGVRLDVSPTTTTRKPFLAFWMDPRTGDCGLVNLDIKLTKISYIQNKFFWQRAEHLLNQLTDYDKKIRYVKAGAIKEKDLQKA